jgi:hypothetical protein
VGGTQGIRARRFFRTTVRTAVVGALAVGGWAWVRLDTPDDGEESRALRAVVDEPVAPLAMAGQGPPRVLIVGDSIADQHGSHAAVALRKAGVDTRLTTLWGRGLFSRDQYDMGRPNPDPPAGSMMAAASQAVDEFDPDVVAIYANHNYWPPYARDASGADITMGSPAFRQMARTQLTELVERLSRGGASVYLISPVPDGRGRPVADNPIWSSYREVQQELGLGVIDSGDALATQAGTRVSSLPDCAGRPAEVGPPGDLHLTYFGSGRMGTRTARAIAGIVGVPVSGVTAPTETPVAMLPMGDGYWLVTCDGATFPFGAGAATFADVDLGGGRPAGEPVVAATIAAPGDRAWALTAGGHVLGYGGVPELGDARLAANGERAVGIVSTPSGQGYWLATSTGDVQVFGDAEPLAGVAAPTDGERVGGSGSGSGTGAGRETAVAMAGAPDGRGYWLLWSDGRVTAAGSARFAGDLGDRPPDEPVVGIAAHPSGEGYWLLDRAGGVYAFGAADDHGSAGGQSMVRIRSWRGLDDYETEAAPASAVTEAVAMLPTVSGDGYWVWLANGAVCRFGDADRLGGLHRAEVDELMLFLRMPYYADGPCDEDVGFGSVARAEIEASQQAAPPPPEP